MTQLTVRGFDDELSRRLRALSRREGISLSQAALRLMKRGAGLPLHSGLADVVGDELDQFIGTWTETDETEFFESIRDCETIDRDLWA